MAFITNATRKVVIDHVVATLGRAPTTKELADVTVLLNDGASLADVAGYLTTSDAYLAKYPIGQTASEAAADILDAAIVGGVLSAELRLAVIDLIAGGLTGGAYTIASATNAVVAYLSDPANNDNADLGDIAKAFQNRTAAAEEFTTTFTLAGATVTAADLAAAVEGVTSDADTLTAAKAAFAAGSKSIAEQAVKDAAAEEKAAEEAAAKAAEEKAAADAAAAEQALVDAATEAAEAAAAAIEAAEAADAAVTAAQTASEEAAATAAETDADALATALETATTADTDAKTALEAATKAYNDAITAGDATAVVTAQGAKIIAQDKADKAAAALVEATEAAEAATAADEAAATAATALEEALAEAASAADAADAAAAAAVEAAAATADTEDDVAAAAQVEAAAAANPVGDAAAEAAAAKAAEEKAAADKAAEEKAAADKAAEEKAAADKAAADEAAAADALKQTLSLTTGLDSLKGGAYDDTINGVVQGAGATGTTAAPGDVIAGGAGTDTLNLSFAGDGNGYTLQALQTSGVENVLVNNFDTNAATTTTIDTALMNGVNKVGLNSSSASGDTVFSGLTAIKDAQMSNGSGDLTLTYVAGTSGTADTQNLAISNVSGGTFTANGLETVAITGSLTANKLTNVASSKLKAITISGDQNFTLTTATAVPTIDASGNTGKTSLTVSAAAGGVGSTITLGSGDDTLDVGTSLNALDKIQGGEGTDTIKISVGAQTYNGGATVASTSEFLQSGGFEVIDIASTNDAATLDVENIAGVETVKAAANVYVAGVTGTTETDGDIVTFTLNGVNYETAARANAAATDTFEELVATKIDSLSGFSAVAGTNVVTITATSGEVVEFGSLAVKAGGTGTIASTGTTGYTNLEVKGITDQSVDIYSADSIKVRLVDSSGTEDVLNVNLKSLATEGVFAQTVGTLDVADTIETLNLDATGMKTGVSSVLKTLTTLTADNSLTTLNITGTDDLTIGTLTAGKLATINASTATGSISLPGTGDLAQTITMGSGNDTLVMAGNLTAADVIDMGANSIAVASTGALGIDTITTTGNIGSSVTAAALQISNAELVTIAGTANYIDGSNLSNVGILGFTNGSGSSTLTNMPVGTAIGLGVGANESTSTYTVSLADATGDDDSLTLTYGSAIDASTSNTLIVSGVETLNVKASAEKDNDETSTLVLTNASVSTINITGGHSGDTTALGTLNKATTTVSAGTNSGAVSFTAATGYGMNVTANGSVANNITLSTKADTVTLTKELAAINHTINGGVTASASTADTLNATLSATNTNFANISDFEVLNLTVKAATDTGFDNTAEDGGLNAASVVNILGGNANSTFKQTVDSVFDNGRTSATPRTVDATTFAGTTTLVFASDALDAATTVKGGASALDSVTTIIAAGADATTGNNPTMTGVEYLTVKSTEGDVDAVINLGGVTGLARVTADFITSTNDDQIEIDSLAAGVPVYVKATATLDNLDVGLASTTGSDDALTVVMVTNTTSLNLDAVGIENLSIIAGGAGGTIDLAGVAPTTGSATTVTLSGASDFVLKSLNTGITNVNGSALGGALTIGKDDRDADAITISGGVNNDSIAMENAADVLSGGTQAVDGADSLVVNYAAVLAGITIDLSAEDQVVSMDGSPNTAVQSGFENVDLSSFTGFGSVVTGSDGANRIVGTALTDRINAGKGDDIYTVGEGNDQVDLGAGNDTALFTEALFINNSQTTATHSGGAGIDTIQLEAASINIVDADFARLTSFETLTLVSGTNNVVVSTNAAAAGIVTINGGTGADTISVAAGDKTINLGAVNDAAVDTILLTAVSGKNTVTGFVSASDTFEISGALKTALYSDTAEVVGDVTANTNTGATYAIETAATGIVDIGNQGTLVAADLSDLTKIATAITGAFVFGDGGVDANANTEVFAVESDTAGTFGIYAWLQSSASDTTVGADELTILGIVTGNDLVAADLDIGA